MTKSWIIGIFLVTVCSAMITLMSPDGEMKKYVRLVASLSVLASIAIPLVFAASKLRYDISIENPSEIDSVSESGFDIISLSAKEIEKSVGDHVATGFSLQRDDVFVTAELDGSDMTAVEIKRVEISVPHGADIRAVKEYVSGLFNGKISVDVKEASEDG